MDDLDVEHDRGDPLQREQVVGRLAREALEARLRVRDVTDDPDRGEKVEQPAKGPAVARLGRPHVRAVRLDPATEGDIGRPERPRELR